MKLLKAGTEAQELELIQTAKEIIDSEGSQESTDAVILSIYSGKLLPLDLIKTNDNKKYIAFTDNPALNPCKENFDSVKYKKVLTEIKGDILEAGELIEEQQKSQERREAAKSLNNGEFFKNLQSIGEYSKGQLQGIDWELLPYIAEEMEKPETVAKFDLKADFNPMAPEWQELIQAAIKEKSKAEKLKSYFAPAIIGRKITDYSFLKSKELALPFDIFNPELNDKRDMNGQIKLMPITTTQHRIKDEKGKDIQTTSFYSIYFSEGLPDHIAKCLNYTDLLVLGAIETCLQTIGQTMTVRQIAKAMGYTGDITDETIKNIISSILKMGGAWIWYDFKEEQALYPNSNFSDIGSPEAYEQMITAKIIKNYEYKGQKFDLVHILEPELPIYRAAKDHNHRIEKIPIKCLQLPGKMHRNQENLAIIFFVLERITLNQTDGETSLLYNSLYSKCGLPETGGTKTTINKKGRIRNNLFKYLEHLKSIEYIEGYEEQKENKKPGVRIIIKRNTPLLKG